MSFTDIIFARDSTWSDASGVQHMLHVRGRDFAEFETNLQLAAHLLPGSAVAPAKPTPTQEPNGPYPVCPDHGTSKPSKFGGYFCTEQYDDGSFCRWQSQTKKNRRAS